MARNRIRRPARSSRSARAAGENVLGRLGGDHDEEYLDHDDDPIAGSERNRMEHGLQRCEVDRGELQDQPGADAPQPSPPSPVEPSCASSPVFTLRRVASSKTR